MASAAGRTLPSSETTASGDDERALVARIRADDYQAFTLLFRTHYADLVRFARRLTASPETAEEVVQDVFIRLWDRRRVWELRGTVRGYLFGATRNHALNAVRGDRAAARWLETSARETEPVAIGRGALPVDAKVEAEEVDAAVARALSRLPERTQMVYALRWRHELRYPEIAEALGISIKTVESHMTRALAVLRKQLTAFR